MCSFCVISTLATSGNERVKTEFDTGLHKHKSGAMGHRAQLKHSLGLITVNYILHLVNFIGGCTHPQHHETTIIILKGCIE